MSEQGSKSVAEFSRLLKGFCDQLATIGRPIDDLDKVHWFLRVLACSIPDSNDSEWYPDSGATSHLTNDPEGVDVPVVYSGNERVMVGNGGFQMRWTGEKRAGGIFDQRRELAGGETTSTPLGESLRFDFPALRSRLFDFCFTCMSYIRDTLLFMC
ncbi:hypothetical protein CK203_087703 [Vitis vinifera]|uniref:Uncharacterized protein n=1 Tax=Vitis vinifera TaxID=29760 RepID=A0A438DPF9_VITVI|nr:hypothetical protein CK203_087703 [Vitis vinifera]